MAILFVNVNIIKQKNSSITNQKRIKENSLNSTSEIKKKMQIL